MSGQSRVPVKSCRGSPTSGSASQSPRIPVLIVFCDEAAAGRTVDVARSVESGSGVNTEPVATAPATPLSVFDDETFYEDPVVSCTAEGRRLARLLLATHPEVHAEDRQTITEVGLTDLVKDLSGMTHTSSFRTCVVNMNNLGPEAEEYFKRRSGLVEGHNSLQVCEDARYDDFRRQFDAC